MPTWHAGNLREPKIVTFEEQETMKTDDVPLCPTKAEFFVAPYEDCGTPRVTVKYDTASDTCADNVWVETGYGTNWIAFEADIADQVCAAIQAAATAIRSRGVTLTAMQPHEGEGA